LEALKARVSAFQFQWRLEPAAEVCDFYRDHPQRQEKRAQCSALWPWPAREWSQPEESRAEAEFDAEHHVGQVVSWWRPFRMRESLPQAEG